MAVRSQLSKLDQNNLIRQRNFNLFIENLDPKKYFTEFSTAGSCNYAFTLVIKNKDDELRKSVIAKLQSLNVEFRRGTAGGGNQLRQPYCKNLNLKYGPEDFPNVDYIHFYGLYIGNYPTLSEEKIYILCDHLNKI